MPWLWWTELLGAFAFGIGVGIIVTYTFIVRNLISGYTRLRYYGFRPEPPPEKPKTVVTPNLPPIRED